MQRNWQRDCENYRAMYLEAREEIMVRLVEIWRVHSWYHYLKSRGVPGHAAGIWARKKKAWPNGWEPVVVTGLQPPYLSEEF